jgi:hypothetical protein
MPFVRLWVLLLLGCSDAGVEVQDLAAHSDAAIDMSVRPMATRCLPASSLPKQLSGLPGLHRRPRLAFTGNGFVVAWNTEIAGGGAYRIDLAVTDGEGNRLGPNISLTGAAVADPSPPTVAPLSGGTVVAWSRITGNGTHIFLSTFDINGQKLDGSGMPCDPGVPECGNFQVTSAANEREPFLTLPTVMPHTALPTDNQVGLTWIEGNGSLGDVFWKKVQGNGTELIPDKPITAMSGKYALPRMAFDGVHQGISWRDDGRSPDADFFFATLDAIGQISSQATNVGSASGPYAALGSPDLVWSDGDYALVAATGGAPAATITLERFASNGVNTLSAHGVTFGGIACTPSVAWDGEAYGIAWQTLCNNPGSSLAFELVDKGANRLAADGSVCPFNEPTCGTAILAGSATTRQIDPEMVWAGGNSFGVVWTEQDAVDGGDTSEVFFQRVDCM